MSVLIDNSITIYEALENIKNGKNRTIPDENLPKLDGLRVGRDRRIQSQACHRHTGCPSFFRPCHASDKIKYDPNHKRVRQQNAHQTGEPAGKREIAQDGQDSSKQGHPSSKGVAFLVEFFP